MKDKDIDKLFEARLKNHQVIPPVQGWEKLNQQLQAQKSRKLLPYWKIAASVFLFISAAALVLFIWKENPEMPEEISVAPAPVTSSEKVDGTEREIREMEPETTEEGVAAIDTANRKHLKKTEGKGERKPLKMQKEKLPSLPSREFLAEVPKVEPMASRPMVSGENPPEPSVHPVGMPAAHDRNEPVTVIYKPPVAHENNEPIEKTLAFLNHLKSNVISFSDLRQAKDELITKAFSSREKEAGE